MHLKHHLYIYLYIYRSTFTTKFTKFLVTVDSSIDLLLRVNYELFTFTWSNKKHLILTILLVLPIKQGGFKHGIFHKCKLNYKGKEIN